MRSLLQSPEGWTVGRRLFLLVLLPLTVLAVTLSVVANDRWSTREAAADVVDRIDDLRALVALQSAVYQERAAVEIELRSASFGVPATLGAGLLGVAEPVDTFDTTNGVLSAAQSAPAGLDELIREARQLHDDGDPSSIPAYDEIDQLIVERFVVELNEMQEIGVGTANGDLAFVLEQLEASVLAFSASTDQTTGLADSWFGAGETRSRSLSTLGFQTARYELAMSRIEESALPPDLRGQLGRRDDVISLAVIQLLAGQLSPPTSGNLEALPVIIAVFEASFARSGGLAELVTTSADEVEATATAIADDASDAFVAALAFGVAAITASVLLSWRLAASIAGPMASVAARTRELQAGQIEASPLVSAGPRELRDVASAINDVSVNLDALEGKLDALARADLDDPRLAEPLPGRLGDTLSKSVDTLSNSIAERRSLEARLGHQASHDALTGLANRAAVLEHLSQCLAFASDAPVGLLFVDLDDFKRANDVFGHGAGDAVLVEVANRLRLTSRPSDMVARLGGDEFLVVAQDVPGVLGLERLAHRIIDVVGAPMPLSEAGGLSIAASIGMALTGNPSVGALNLLAHADAALYLAKSSDGRIAVFDDDLEAKIGRQATIEQRLHVALAADEFEVHYQPVLHSDSLRVGQLEALVRWVGDDTYGPDVFIPVAEQSDLVIEIDRLVLNTATRDLAAILASGIEPGLSVAVNISGRHLLHADVVDHVTSALRASQLDPSRLIIEVTETALIVDLDRAAEHLGALRAMNIRVSVDDFGTGFTSISQLRRLPIDELKIDQSLVAELPGEPALVRVVRDLAEHFGLTTVAEGVETTEQAEFLRDLGCSQLQGWLYAKAMPVAELAPWFASRNEIRSSDRVGTTDLP